MKSWLERLEISVVPLASLERTLRVDAEFYSKKNLLVASQLSAMPHIPITDAFDVSDGNHMSISDDFQESGVPYYRGQDSCHMFIEDASPVCIGLRNYQKTVMQRSHLHKDDVLLSIVGTIGNVSYVATEEKAICSCKLAILRAKHRTISPECLYLFLQTTYGQNQIQKFRRGAVQMGLILEDMDQLMIPLFSDRFQAALKQTIAKLYEMDSAARKNYQDAEACLAQAIGYYDYQPAKQQNSVRSLNEILSAGRIDAEYYQPKYDDLKSILHRHPVKSLGELVTIQKSIEPGSSEYQADGIPFYRVADLSPFWLGTPSVHLSPRDYATALRPKKDTILLSKDGSIGIACKVEEDLDGITSSALLHLTLVDDACNPDYLTLVLNSSVVKMQAEQAAGGSIIQHWLMDDIRNVEIPLLGREEQAQIQTLLQRAHADRVAANNLLATARRAVECFIEQGEAAALTVLAPDSEA